VSGSPTPTGTIGNGGSTTGDWITWETADGFVLVSSDGTRERKLSDGPWFAHTWSRDGTHLFGIRETEALRLSLVSLDATTGTVEVIADLGPTAPVNNPVKGLSVSADGHRFVTSIVSLRADLWTAAHVSWQDSPSVWRRLFRRP